MALSNHDAPIGFLDNQRSFEAADKETLLILLIFLVVLVRYGFGGDQPNGFRRRNKESA